MRSTLAWLDHSEVQRRKMMEVIDLFREKGTVDNLGLGSVRDTLSELLFPGTSTLHTRAKYLLFVPWLCRQLEGERTPSHRGWQRLKDLEIELIYALLNGGEQEGVIGRDAKETLKQFPSFMYWSAVRRYGILATPTTRAQLISGLDASHEAQKQARRFRDETSEWRRPRTWHAGLPPAEEGMLESTDFALTPDQASYLTDRIQVAAPDSYLAHLVAVGVRADVANPWMDPSVPSAPPGVQRTVTHAQRFSEVMHGAQLLYNLQVSEAIHRRQSDDGDLDVDDDLVDTYRSALDDWASTIEQQRGELNTWDEPGFWQLIGERNPRLPAATQRFAVWWIDEVRRRPPLELVDDQAIRETIRGRELETKGRLARLWDDRRLERYGGAAGAGQLNFRWGQVHRVITDITEARTDSSEHVVAGTAVADART